MTWLIAFVVAAHAAPTSTEPTEKVSEDDLARAATLFESGVQMYDEAKYKQAIEAFQASYELSGEHGLLYNVANAQERLGDLQATIDTLNTYRIYADADEKKVVQRRVDALEARLLKERTQQAEAAEAAAKLATAAAEAAKLTAAPAVTKPTFETKTNNAKWALVGAGAGTAVVFGALAGITYGEGQQHRDAFDQTSYDSTRTLNNVSLALAAVGAGLTGVGLALPSKRTVPIVGLGIQSDRTDIALTWTY